MSTRIIAFPSNTGGVGKTSLVCHLAWMMADQGLRVLVGDLDPQSQLTAVFLDEDRMERVLFGSTPQSTIFGCIRPLFDGTGDIIPACVESVNERLALVPGDTAMFAFEDSLAEAWPKCLDRDERAFRVTSAFWRVLQNAAGSHRADVILIDLGPNLGAINRAALIASDYVAIPLGPDLFSLQSLQSLGPALQRWREGWQERIARNPNSDLLLPPGRIEPIGYMVLRHSVRLDRPAKASERWMARIPQTYRDAVLIEQNAGPVPKTVDEDPHCIAKLRDYRSLMPLAQEARKPTFFLKAADGAMGAHGLAVAQAYRDFLAVADEIALRTGIKAA